MSFTKTIVCLANSRKNSGRCLAGKEKLAGNQLSWIRPVGTTETKELNEYDRQYSDGTTAQNLDIIEIHFNHVDQHSFQAENFVIDSKAYWRKVGFFPKYRLNELQDYPMQLWENGESSYSGFNDRVALAHLAAKRASLYFIKPNKAQIHVSAEGAAFNDSKLKVRAHFTYNNVNYALLVTDPFIEAKYVAMGVGQYSIDPDSYFTVSLGEPYNGFAYKLVAAIL
ncbi:dual OB domain-containing protein [Xanthomonas arboricola]|uniref:dual OB domain-containing protein n=1 Tax=Xanthomonas arboricola TaxID=56448 RepID=UPI001620F643|nr:hypothetical protein [Xanthomonas arboricola]MBB5858488.1 hypothetical protein [Xanthomonas arboricola]